MNYFLRCITSFGDVGLLGPVALFLAMYLYCIKCSRQAFALLAAFAASSGLIALAKIVAFANSASFSSWSLPSPSGHSAVSAATYGMVTAIAAEKRTGSQRVMAWLLGVSFVLAIAVSRVALHAHTLTDVVVGLAVGWAALLSVLQLSKPGQARDFEAHGMWWTLLLISSVFYGATTGAEMWLHRLVDCSFRQCLGFL